ncbi:MAG TPA: response regulator [Kofleriaceae bacterium]|nr:response regulator [Kofleriaceae bacterium]
MRVLVVDDYPGAADIACILVRMLGHDARGAKTGKQAVDEAAAFEPDVIVLDIGLPDFDGYEVARRVRAQPGKRPFIAAMTGWDHPDRRALSLAAGIDMHVLKPASEESLTNILEAAKKQLSEPDEALPA